MSTHLRNIILLVALITGSVLSVAQVNLTVTATQGSWPTEVGWQVVNTATNVTYNCEAQGGSVQSGTVFNVPAGNYEVRAFDSYGDGWNGASMTIVYTTGGQTLVNAATWNTSGAQSMTCPGPNAVNNAAQVIARFTVIIPCFAPTINTQPQSQSICGGASATFSVSATYYTSGTCEWFKDGVSLGAPGPTNFTYTIPSVQPTDAAVYSCVLRDNCNPTTAVIYSGGARLTVIAQPAITTNLPLTRVVCENANDTLRVRAVGAGKTFQWYKDGAIIAGATDSNYVINNAQQSTTSGNYYCIVTGSCTPPATSAYCALTVATKPRITLEPNNLDVCPGTSGSIGVSATGNNLIYQWYKDGVVVGGANTPTLSFTNYTAASNGRYYCLVTSNIPNPNNCNVTAQSRTVRVSGFTSPIVSLQPKSSDVCAGTSASIVCQATGTGLSYQWFKDGQPVAGQVSNELNIQNVTPAAAGRYILEVTGSCNLKVKSDTATLTVVAKPTMTTQPVSAKLGVGDRLDLTAAATDVRTVQWYKNDVAIPGATTSSYSIASVVKSDAGFYSVKFTNTCGSVLSAYARVEVSDPVVPKPALELGQVSVDFGEIPVGYDKSETVTGLIKNVGTAPLSITSLSASPAEFTLSNTPAVPFDIAPGTAQSVTIKAAPTAQGPLFGTLVIKSNAPLTPQASVALTASYVLRYSHDASAAFGILETGKTKEMCVKLTNTSTKDITIDQATVTGMNASEFSVKTTLPLSIATGASADLCLTFAPGTAGKKSAQVSVRSANGGNSTIDLSGTGEVPGGVIDAAVAGLSVWPNPARDGVSIRFAKHTPAMTVSIVNAAGATLAQFQHDAVEAGATARFDLSSVVSSGTYTITLRYGQDVVTVPITVVK